MLMEEALDAYFYLARHSAVLAESEESGLGLIAMKAALGDSAALAKIFERYHTPLFKVAAAHALNSEEAEDAVHEVFLRLVQGRFSAHAASFEKDARRLWLLLAQSVRHQVVQQHRKKKKEVVGVLGTGDDNDEDDLLDPESPDEFTAAEKTVVHTALQRAWDAAKLTPEENGFVSSLLASGTLLGTGGMSIKDLALKFWPDKSTNAALVSANRAKTRFLKQLCQDPELRALLPAGRSRGAASSFFRKNLEPLCTQGEDCDPVVVFALALDESTTSLDRDTAYTEVLRWVCSNL